MRRENERCALVSHRCRENIAPFRYRHTGTKKVLPILQLRALPHFKSWRMLRFSADLFPDDTLARAVIMNPSLILIAATILVLMYN